MKTKIKQRNKKRCCELGSALHSKHHTVLSCTLTVLALFGDL